MKVADLTDINGESPCDHPIVDRIWAAFGWYHYIYIYIRVDPKNWWENAAFPLDDRKIALHNPSQIIYP